MPGIICEKMCPQDVCYITYLKEYSVIWSYEELGSSPIVSFGLLVMHTAIQMYAFMSQYTCS